MNIPKPTCNADKQKKCNAYRVAVALETALAIIIRNRLGEKSREEKRRRKKERRKEKKKEEKAQHVEAYKIVHIILK